MKKLSKFSLLFGLILFILFSCDEESTNENDHVTAEIKKITDFGCDSCFIGLNYEYFKNDTSYIICTESDFNKYVNIRYISEDAIPIIDFEKYFLIVGKKFFVSGSGIKEEKIEEYNDEIVFYVTYLIYETDSPTIILYYAFIEKPTNEKPIRVKLIQSFDY